MIQGRLKNMKVGFIGCGGFVQGTHLPNIHKSSNLEVHALCDLDEIILSCLDKIYAPKYTTKNFLDIADDKDIEMVVISTSPNVRVDPIRTMAKAGKHIFVEKPMGLGVEDCKEILDIISDNGVKLQVGFNRPCSLIMQDTKRIYKKIVKGETLLSYRIVGEDILWPEFHCVNVKSGISNTIIHEIVHIFDLFNWLTDMNPLEMYTIGGHSDNNIISITYPNDIAAVIISGSNGTEAYPKERMEIYTDNKALIMDSFIELICRRIPGESDRCYPPKTPLSNFINIIFKSSTSTTGLSFFCESGGQFSSCQPVLAGSDKSRLSEI